MVDAALYGDPIDEQRWQSEMPAYIAHANAEAMRLVGAGEELLVTDRGRVIAQIGPPGRSAYDALPPGAGELARRGLIRLGAPNEPSVYPLLSAVGPVGVATRLLDHERGEHERLR